MLKLVLGALGSFFTSSLSAVSNDLKEAYQSKLNAANDSERIAADERISLLEARKDTILAAQSDPVERWVRVLFALPFVIYTWKLVVYDKVLAWGATDALSAELSHLMWVVIGGYFVDGTVRYVAKVRRK